MSSPDMAGFLQSEVPRRERNRAFSLAEILVVMGIIAVLVALLLPMLNKAREESRRLTCAANLKTLGQAMTTYAVANQDKYPGCLYKGLWGPGHGSSGPVVAIWPTRLRICLGGDQRAFYCPAQPESFKWLVTPAAGVTVAEPAPASLAPGGYRIGEQMLDVATVPFSYGYNDWGCVTSFDFFNDKNQRGMGSDIDSTGKTTGAWACGALHERRISSIAHPDRMVAITDKMTVPPWPTINYGYGADPPQWNFNTSAYQAVKPTSTLAYQYSQSPGNLHSGGSNVLFADGHVEWMLQQSLIVGDVKTRQPYAFNSPQWNAVATLYNSDGKP